MTQICFQRLALHAIPRRAKGVQERPDFNRVTQGRADGSRLKNDPSGIGNTVEHRCQDQASLRRAVGSSQCGSESIRSHSRDIQHHQGGLRYRAQRDGHAPLAFAKAVSSRI